MEILDALPFLTIIIGAALVVFLPIRIPEEDPADTDYTPGQPYPTNVSSPTPAGYHTKRSGHIADIKAWGNSTPTRSLYKHEELCDCAIGEDHAEA